MYDIIIIGAGTVGLTICNLLSKLNLKICLIEKNSFINKVSNAVGVNDECLLAWELCGVLDKISSYIGYNKDRDLILKYLSAKQEEIFSLYQSYGINRFPKGVVFLQNKIDEILLNNLQGKVDIKFGEELLELEQIQEQVLLNTNKAKYKAKYLIAADGKDSLVRNILDIKVNQLSESKDEWLILNLLKQQSATKEFVEVFCGERSAVSCPLPLNYHRLEISLKESEKDILNDEEKIKNLAEDYIDFKDYKIVDKFKYRFITAIAQSYYDKRVVLCGDAAHQTSPFASSGLVSGIRDSLILYDLFKSQKIDFSVYQKARYKKQLKSLKLAIILEKLMRPNRFIERVLFSFLRFFSTNKRLLKFLSLRS